MTFRLLPDDQWFRSKNGNGVLAGSPLTYFGVTDAGAKILDAIETNSELPQNHSQLTDRLLATGAVHPVPDNSVELSDITVVIPAFIVDAESHAYLEKLVASLHGLTVIIVDDASPFSVHLNGVHIVRNNYAHSQVGGDCHVTVGSCNRPAGCSCITASNICRLDVINSTTLNKFVINF